MDHLIPSSTATAITTCNLDSDNTYQGKPPKCTYTTAGTIYNPKSAQPLQAPTRRARALKFPFGTTTSGQPALFPKSALASLGLEASARAQGGPHPQYSPLQQNLDRAVSPGSRLIKQKNTVQMPLTPESPNDLVKEVLTLHSADMPPSPEVSVLNSVSVDKLFGIDAASEYFDDDDDIDIGQEPLRNFPVKSLHNLASYPNPNQTRAQRVLRSARPTANSTTSNETSTRSNTPYHGNKDEQPQPTMALQSVYNDLTAMRRAHPEAMNRDGAASIAASTDHFNNADGKRNVLDTYKTPLASGPGVPRPLTAGPPGQRQFKPPVIDLALKNPGSGEPVTRRVPEEDYEATIEFRALVESKIDNECGTAWSFTPKPLPTRGPVQTVTPLQHQSPIGTGSSHSSNLHRPAHEVSHHSASHIQQPQNLADCFKRQGRGRLVSRHSEIEGQHERKKWESGTYRRTAEEIKARNNLTFKQFCGEHPKTNADTQGSISNGEAEIHGCSKASVGIVDDMKHQQMIIQQANQAPTSDYMTPLLAMALSTLTRNVDAMERGLYSRQYKKPEAHQVDSSPAGLQTFFRQTGGIEE